MAGTFEGGLKASITNKKLHGEDFYKRIGRIGGARGTTGGFAANRELARIAGAKGGRISRRGKAANTLLKEQARLDKETGRSAEKMWSKRAQPEFVADTIGEVHYEDPKKSKWWQFRHK